MVNIAMATLTSQNISFYRLKDHIFVFCIASTPPNMAMKNILLWGELIYDYQFIFDTVLQFQCSTVGCVHF